MELKKTQESNALGDVFPALKLIGNTNIVFIDYFLVRCPECGSTWGIRTNKKPLYEVDLSCRNCKYLNK